MDRPNILWIVTTQWRAQACGYVGDANARTPYLDALAAESLNFTQAVTPHPFGPFARAAMLTGVPSPENGVRDYFDPLPPDARTIAHELGARGYATAFFGKWHLGQRDPAAPLVGEAHAKIVVPPEARGGFDFWEGFESGFLLNDPWLHGSRLLQPEKFSGYQSDVVCGRAAEWIGEEERGQRPEAGGQKPEAGGRRPEVRDQKAEARDQKAEARDQKAEARGQKPEAGGQRTEVRGQKTEAGGQRSEARSGRTEDRKQPWFCVVSLEPPHPPYDAPSAGVPARDGRGILLSANVPRGGEAEAQARRELAGYYAHIEATDRAIGRLLAGVPRETTAVVFTSVHGDMHGAHGLFRKGWPHEESVRVPLLVRHPQRPEARGLKPETRGQRSEVRDQKEEAGGLKPEVGEQRAEVGSQKREVRGATRADAVSLMDLPAMAVAWAEGRAWVCTCEEAKISMPSVVRLPQQCDRAWRGVRTPWRKLVFNPDGTPWLFFDLENDPGELRNLAEDAAHAKEIAELRARVR